MSPPNKPDSSHHHLEVSSNTVDAAPLIGEHQGINYDDQEIASLPRILLMGPRRGGKTSIQRVVFQKMSPHETLFRLETTQDIERTLVDHTALCRFVVHDFPGEYYAELPANDRTSLLFVVDAQDEPYDHVLQSFTTAVTHALETHPNIFVEVFIHKVDGELFLSDDSKYDCRRDVMTQVADELAEAGVPPDSVHVRYHLTSIYDFSIYEALSKVVQRLIPALPTLENLLNVMVSTCSMEKAFLFDVVSKLYLSTDNVPADPQSVELCADMIDVVLDVSGIYGIRPEAEKKQIEAPSPEAEEEEAVLEGGSAYDEESSSVIRLANGMVLYLKEVDTMLALVCITRSENFRRKSLINYNIGCLKRALRALVQPELGTDAPSLVARVAE